MTNVLERFRTRAEQAQANYQRSVRELFIDEEQTLPRFPAEAHAERLAALRRQRAREIDEVLEDLRRVADESRQELENFENADPTALLGAAELDAAASRMDFVHADAWSLPTAQLRDRLATVLASGDRVSIFCHWRGAAARNANLGDRDLDALLASMRDHLAGRERLAKLERARAILEEADKTELYVSNLKRGARSSSEAYLNRLTEAAS